MRWIIFIGLAVFLALSVASIAVAAPGDGPATALYISGTPQTLEANAVRWYKFDYAGDRSDITVLMPNGAGTLVAYNVFTPEQAQSWWDTPPIGRGTAYQIDCDTGEEKPGGECQSPDLKWVGKFNAPGTYYVQVLNYNTGPANFILTVTGTGVTVGTVLPTPPAPAVPISPIPTPRPPILLPVTGGVWPDAPAFP